MSKDEATKSESPPNRSLKMRLVMAAGIAAMIIRIPFAVSGSGICLKIKMKIMGVITSLSRDNNHTCRSKTVLTFSA